MNYLKFNRHEIFNSKDRSAVLDAINDVKHNDTTNMLFGLFDGYLYDELPSLLQEENWKNSLSNQNYAKMTMLLYKIKNHLNK